jgi:hypothetical protein
MEKKRQPLHREDFDEAIDCQHRFDFRLKAPI